MMQYIKLFLITVPTVILVDYIWVGKLMFKFYDTGIGALARRMGGEFKPMVAPIFIVYIVMAIGLTVFIYPRFINGNIDFKVFLLGALLGFVIYAIYDFTNYGTLANWSLKLSIIDILWGSFLSGLVSFIVLSIGKFLNII